MHRRRSLHFVPGGNEKMIAKALTLPADGLILDLEDAVAPDRKAATRPIVREWLQKLDFGGRDDITASQTSSVTRRARGRPARTVSMATLTGSVKRRGPALPGFRKRTPSRSSTDGRCE